MELNESDWSAKNLKNFIKKKRKNLKKKKNKKLQEDEDKEEIKIDVKKNEG